MQFVVKWTHNPLVRGSNPCRPTKYVNQNKGALLSGLTRIGSVQVVAGLLLKMRLFLPRFEIRGTFGVMGGVG